MLSEEVRGDTADRTLVRVAAEAPPAWDHEVEVAGEAVVEVAAVVAAGR